VTAWHAMWGPKGLPADVTQKLTAALQAALKDEKVIERFASLATEPVKLDQATPAALKAHLVAEVAKWGPVYQVRGSQGRQLRPNDLRLNDVTARGVPDAPVRPLLRCTR
jgi:putative tricarboxylic transport membrane protein